jgi:hypothetical protein
MLRKFPLYPILFSIFPVLSLAAYNIDEISWDAVFRPLFVSLFIGIFFFGLAKLIVRDWNRAAFAVLLVLFFFFIYGQVYNVLEDVTMRSLSLFRHRTLLPLFIIVLLLSLVFVLRRGHRPSPYWLNLLSIVLLVYPIFQIVSNVLQQWSAERALSGSDNRVTANANQPDIYYIILDAYGRADVLQDLLG